jgi:endonuclease/exonuclease/phosphatase family metal-dependent hydrolase
MFFLIFLSLKKSYYAVFPMLTLLISIPHINETFAVNLNKTDLNQSKFSITSYNVGSFNYKRLDSINDINATKTTMHWLKENNHTDILCLQEFYNNDTVKYESTLDSLKEKGYKYHHCSDPSKKSNPQGFVGVITLSRHPIVNSGSIFLENRKRNKALFTDILLHDDTIRVINIHLKSMTIRFDKTESIFHNIATIATKLKKGFSHHNEEIDVIANFIQESPYKTILCGDFNGLPYSYSYRKTKKLLQNSFEEAGFGFGFTYNKFPWFIRIDNQFHDRRIKALEFKVHNDTFGSDHYPIEGTYGFVE